jgi:hypothetical protein
MRARVEEFFGRYEKANAAFEVGQIVPLYADVFMFANPQGAQAITKEDFVRVLPRRKEFFRSMGLVSSTVESVEASNLDSRYVLAKVTWNMRFECGNGESIENQNSATYVLADTGGAFQIVFQLDHQDLMERVKALGLSR